MCKDVGIRLLTGDNLLGNKIENLENEAACQLQCQGTTSCDLWQYWPSLKLCELGSNSHIIASKIYEGPYEPITGKPTCLTADDECKLARR